MNNNKNQKIKLNQVQAGICELNSAWYKVSSDVFTQGLCFGEWYALREALLAYRDRLAKLEIELIVGEAK
jgi:hypothetical protein